MGKYNVYAGYYELYVTNKIMGNPRVLLLNSDCVEDVIKCIEEADEWTAVDADVYSDFYGVPLELGNHIGNVFKIDENTGTVVVLCKETEHLFNK